MSWLDRLGMAVGRNPSMLGRYFEEQRKQQLPQLPQLKGPIPAPEDLMAQPASTAVNVPYEPPQVQVQTRPVPEFRAQGTQDRGMINIPAKPPSQGPLVDFTRGALTQAATIPAQVAASMSRVIPRPFALPGEPSLGETHFAPYVKRAQEKLPETTSAAMGQATVDMAALAVAFGASSAVVRGVAGAGSRAVTRHAVKKFAGNTKVPFNPNRSLFQTVDDMLAAKTPAQKQYMNSLKGLNQTLRVLENPTLATTRLGKTAAQIAQFAPVDVAIATDRDSRLNLIDSDSFTARLAGNLATTGVFVVGANGIRAVNKSNWLRSLGRKTTTDGIPVPSRETWWQETAKPWMKETAEQASRRRGKWPADAGLGTTDPFEAMRQASKPKPKSHPNEIVVDLDDFDATREIVENATRATSQGLVGSTQPIITPAIGRAKLLGPGRSSERPERISRQSTDIFGDFAGEDAPEGFVKMRQPEQVSKSGETRPASFYLSEKTIDIADPEEATKRYSTIAEAIRHTSVGEDDKGAKVATWISELPKSGDLISKKGEFPGRVRGPELKRTGFYDHLARLDQQMRLTKPEMLRLFDDFRMRVIWTTRESGPSFPLEQRQGLQIVEVEPDPETKASFEQEIRNVELDENVIPGSKAARIAYLETKMGVAKEERKAPVNNVEYELDMRAKVDQSIPENWREDPGTFGKLGEAQYFERLLSTIIRHGELRKDVHADTDLLLEDLYWYKGNKLIDYAGVQAEQVPTEVKATEVLARPFSQSYVPPELAQNEATRDAWEAIESDKALEAEFGADQGAKYGWNLPYTADDLTLSQGNLVRKIMEEVESGEITSLNDLMERHEKFKDLKMLDADMTLPFGRVEFPLTLRAFRLAAERGSDDHFGKASTLNNKLKELPTKTVHATQPLLGELTTPRVAVFGPTKRSLAPFKGESFTAEGKSFGGHQAAPRLQRAVVGDLAEGEKDAGTYDRPYPETLHYIQEALTHGIQQVNIAAVAFNRAKKGIGKDKQYMVVDAETGMASIDNTVRTGESMHYSLEGRPGALPQHTVYERLGSAPEDAEVALQRAKGSPKLEGRGEKIRRKEAMGGDYPSWGDPRYYRSFLTYEEAAQYVLAYEKMAQHGHRTSRDIQLYADYVLRSPGTPSDVIPGSIMHTFFSTPPGAVPGVTGKRVDVTPKGSPGHSDPPTSQMRLRTSGRYGTDTSEPSPEGEAKVVRAAMIDEAQKDRQLGTLGSSAGSTVTVNELAAETDELMTLIFESPDIDPFQGTLRQRIQDRTGYADEYLDEQLAKKELSDLDREALYKNVDIYVPSKAGTLELEEFSNYALEDPQNPYQVIIPEFVEAISASRTTVVRGKSEQQVKDLTAQVLFDAVQKDSGKPIDDMAELPLRQMSQSAVAAVQRMIDQVFHHNSRLEAQGHDRTHPEWIHHITWLTGEQSAKQYYKESHLQMSNANLRYGKLGDIYDEIYGGDVDAWDVGLDETVFAGEGSAETMALVISNPNGIDASYFGGDPYEYWPARRNRGQVKLVGSDGRVIPVGDHQTATELVVPLKTEQALEGWYNEKFDKSEPPETIKNLIAGEPNELGMKTLENAEFFLHDGQSHMARQVIFTRVVKDYFKKLYGLDIVGDFVHYEGHVWRDKKGSTKPEGQLHVPDDMFGVFKNLGVTVQEYKPSTTMSGPEQGLLIVDAPWKGGEKAWRNSLANLENIRVALSITGQDPTGKNLKQVDRRRQQEVLQLAQANPIMMNAFESVNNGGLGLHQGVFEHGGKLRDQPHLNLGDRIPVNGEHGIFYRRGINHYLEELQKHVRDAQSASDPTEFAAADEPFEITIQTIQQGGMKRLRPGWEQYLQNRVSSDAHDIWEMKQNELIFHVIAEAYEWRSRGQVANVSELDNILYRAEKLRTHLEPVVGDQGEHINMAEWLDRRILGHPLLRLYSLAKEHPDNPYFSRDLMDEVGGMSWISEAIDEMVHTAENWTDSMAPPNTVSLHLMERLMGHAYVKDAGGGLHLKLDSYYAQLFHRQSNYDLTYDPEGHSLNADVWKTDDLVNNTFGFSSTDWQSIKDSGEFSPKRYEDIVAELDDPHFSPNPEGTSGYEMFNEHGRARFEAYREYLAVKDPEQLAGELALRGQGADRQTFAEADHLARGGNLDDFVASPGPPLDPEIVARDGDYDEAVQYASIMRQVQQSSRDPYGAIAESGSTIARMAPENHPAMGLGGPEINTPAQLTPMIQALRQQPVWSSSMNRFMQDMELFNPLNKYASVTGIAANGEVMGEIPNGEVALDQSNLGLGYGHDNWADANGGPLSLNHRPFGERQGTIAGEESTIALNSSKNAFQQDLVVSNRPPIMTGGPAEGHIDESTVERLLAIYRAAKYPETRAEALRRTDIPGLQNKRNGMAPNYVESGRSMGELDDTREVQEWQLENHPEIWEVETQSGGISGYARNVHSSITEKLAARALNPAHQSIGIKKDLTGSRPVIGHVVDGTNRSHEPSWNRWDASWPSTMVQGEITKKALSPEQVMNQLASSAGRDLMQNANQRLKSERGLGYRGATQGVANDHALRSVITALRYDPKVETLEDAIRQIAARKSIVPSGYMVTLPKRYFPHTSEQFDESGFLGHPGLAESILKHDVDLRSLPWETHEAELESGGLSAVQNNVANFADVVDQIRPLYKQYTDNARQVYGDAYDPFSIQVWKVNSSKPLVEGYEDRFPIGEAIGDKAALSDDHLSYELVDGGSLQEAHHFNQMVPDGSEGTFKHELQSGNPLLYAIEKASNSNIEFSVAMSQHRSNSHSILPEEIYQNMVQENRKVEQPILWNNRGTDLPRFLDRYSDKLWADGTPVSDIEVSLKETLEMLETQTDQGIEGTIYHGWSMDNGFNSVKMAFPEEIFPGGKLGDPVYFTAAQAYYALDQLARLQALNPQMQIYKSSNAPGQSREISPGDPMSVVAMSHQKGDLSAEVNTYKQWLQVMGPDLANLLLAHQKGWNVYDGSKYEIDVPEEPGFGKNAFIKQPLEDLSSIPEYVNKVLAELDKLEPLDHVGSNPEEVSTTSETLYLKLYSVLQNWEQVIAELGGTNPGIKITPELEAKYRETKGRQPDLWGTGILAPGALGAMGEEEEGDEGGGLTGPAALIAAMALSRGKFRGGKGGGRKPSSTRKPKLAGPPGVTPTPGVTPSLGKTVMENPIPKRGIFRKAGDKTKTSPRASAHERNKRLTQVEGALDYLEQQPEANQIWTPNSRQVFDRTGFDPDYRMRLGEDTVNPSTGEKKRTKNIGKMVSSDRMQNVLDRQVLLGLPKGGRGFYNLEPIKAEVETMNTIMSFDDFVAATSAASAQNPIMQELAGGSILMYATVNDIPYEAARAAMIEQFKEFPSIRRPMFSKNHGLTFDQYLLTKDIQPKSTASGGRKIPIYFKAKLGEESGKRATVDTHMQKGTIWPVGYEGMIERLTGQEYTDIEEAVYEKGAERLGIQSGQYQAGQWIGGGPMSGLQSPQGDYVQHVEDMILYSAIVTGHDASPKGLKEYFRKVLDGETFFVPWYRQGSPIMEDGSLHPAVKLMLAGVAADEIAEQYPETKQLNGRL